MKSARLIKRAVLPSPAVSHPLPPSAAVRVETVSTVRRWVEEHQCSRRVKPRNAFAALFIPSESASIGVTK